MKRILILCILILCIIPFVSAAPVSFGSGTNFTLANEDSTFWFKNGYFTVTSTTALEICQKYGYTSVYTDYYSTFALRKISDGTWVGANDGIPNPAYPRNVSLTDLGVDALTYDRIGYVAYCTFPGAIPHLYAYHPFYNSSAYAPAPIANFTGTPLNATAPTYVAFTDTSTNETSGCTYNWSFTPSLGIMTSPGGLEQESPTVYFTLPDDYTVSHGVSCPAGSNISTKTDYVHIVNSTGAITTCFAATDALSGYQLSGANFQMYDIENTSWTNKTSSSTGSECITTISGHTINAYTDMLGYGDGDLLAVTPRSSPDYPILMFPANASNVSAGNVTLYVTVREMYSPGLPISGAQVDMTYNFPAIEQKFTEASGMVSFVVPNKTTIYLAAQKSGYSGKSITIDSGNGNGGDASISTTIYLPLRTVTTAPTATTLPGGGTPAPTLTYLANCDPNAPDYDAAKCRTSKGGSGLNILADNLDGLVWLCLIATVIYLIKGIGK